MADDVLVNKAAAIERAVRRVREEYADDDANLTANQTRQDAIILNLQRACEGAIDASLALRLRRMVGFRNVAVHDYQRLSLDIVRSIVRERLDDFLEFTAVLLRQ